GGEHGQILRDGVAENRPEDTEVVTAAVAAAQDGLFPELIRDANARRPVQRVLDATVQTDAADAGDADVRRWNIRALPVDRREQEASLVRAVDGLRVDDVEAQAVVHRHLP